MSLIFNDAGNGANPKEEKIVNEQEQNKPVNDGADTYSEQLESNSSAKQEAEETKSKLENSLDKNRKNKEENES